MTLRINFNIGSTIAQRALDSTTRNLSGSFRRLSSGLRISTAAEDAAGLAISERLRAQIRSKEQATRNANDGISLLQTIEGSLAEVGNLLARLRELAVQAANGTVLNPDKDTLQQEFESLRSEIDRIARSTEFASINLLDGSSSVVAFQVGIGAAHDINRVSVSLDPALSTSLALSTLDIGSGGNPSLAIGHVDVAIDTVSSLRGRLGAVQNRLNVTINNLSTQSAVRAAANRIRDVDLAHEIVLQAKYAILQQASLAILAQANAHPAAALFLLGVEDTKKPRLRRPFEL